MKAITLACVLLLSAAHVAAADPITLNDTGCTSGAVCFTPAPTVDYLAVSSAYGRVTASVNGVLYDSGLYAVPITVADTFTVSATLYGPNNSLLTVSANFKHWTTRTYSGRGQMYVQHFELTGGTLQ